MRLAWVGMIAALVVGMALTATGSSAEGVAVLDGGPKLNAATWECTAGHQIQKRQLTIDSGAVRYSFSICGCTDPSHGDQHPCSEGIFGMPTPSRANWYAGGFMKILINGADATLYGASDVRVLETGDRGSFQVVWAHPDAEVGMRMMMLPGGNHVLTDLTWRPREGKTVETVALQLICYPSYFTTFNHRDGDRHVMTPGTDVVQPESFDLVAEQDTWLYYYDTIFDVAKGEGDGPCAMAIDPPALAGGRVSIGAYGTSTRIDLKPEPGGARVAFYDFTGLTNAQAEEYMTGHGAGDLAELAATDFRPDPVRELDVAALAAEANGLLADAADDGEV